jgi:hypothetical protein
MRGCAAPKNIDAHIIQHLDAVAMQHGVGFLRR